MRPVWLLLLSMTLMSTGCQSFPGLAWDEDPATLVDTGSDPWIHEAGDVARGARPQEQIRDPLGLRDFFTSEKARDIERNLGVGD